MGFEPSRPSHVETANEFMDQMKCSVDEARAALTKARDEMVLYYNQHQNPAPEYKVGDLVYVSSEDFWTTQPAQKLSHRYLGPWPIMAKVSNSAFHVQLPLQYSRVHPVFGVIKLMPAPQDRVEGQQ